MPNTSFSTIQKYIEEIIIMKQIIILTHSNSLGVKLLCMRIFLLIVLLNTVKNLLHAVTSDTNTSHVSCSKEFIPW